MLSCYFENKYRAAPVALLNSYNKTFKNTQLNQLPQEKSCLQPEKKNNTAAGMIRGLTGGLQPIMETGENKSYWNIPDF